MHLEVAAKKSDWKGECQTQGGGVAMGCWDRIGDGVKGKFISKGGFFWDAGDVLSARNRGACSAPGNV